jgi:general secretion pathway protein N
MKKIWLLAVLGLAAYLAFALITLPASVVLDRLQPYGINTAGVSGTAWSGSAQVVQAGAVNLGALSWELRVLPLFALRAVADVEVRRADGFISGTVSASRDRIRLQKLTVALPLGALPPQVAPGGWTGSIDAELADLTLVNGWPTSANGAVEVLDLTGPARRPLNIGSYRVTFPAPTTVPDALTGTLNDIGGQIQIAGTIQLKAADRSYLLEGLVATKPDAPPDLIRTLEFLGPPDAQGRRQFSVSGTM